MSHHLVITYDYTCCYQVLSDDYVGHHQDVTCSHFIPKVIIWMVDAQLMKSNQTMMGAQTPSLQQTPSNNWIPTINGCVLLASH